MKEYEQFIKQNEDVEAWLKGRPINTRRMFARTVKGFCQDMCISPTEWRDMDKFKARDLAWKYIQSKTDHPAVAHVSLAALKSFYRNKNGEALPFDSVRGGKHYLHVPLQKAAQEHIPNKTEMYQIIDAASSLRDKSILFFLFQSGCRVNVVQHLKLKDIMEGLDKDTFTLKIIPDLDNKLRGRDIPFYYTFLNGEGAETLKRYVTYAHKKMNQEANLFYTQKSHAAISQAYVWCIVKNCSKKAGLNATNMWTHSIRKAFRKIVRQADIDDDDKEQLMGHVLSGSRGSYYDSKDVETILAAYRKCNFTREVPKGEFEKLREQLSNERMERALNEEKINTLETQLLAMQKQLKQILNQKA
jgi:site-specific recombinase XerD